MKRVIVSVICFAMLISSLLGGCGAKQAGNESESSQSANSQSASSSSQPSTASQAYTLPIVKDGSVTITVGIVDNYYTPASYTLGLPVWNEIEKKTGVKIKWDVTPSAQFTTVMQTRLATATDLPDFISIPNDDPVRYGINGIIVPMEELINKYAPNIKKYYNDFPEIKKLSMAPDGHIYSISADVAGTINADPYGDMIRKDWLDKLSLKEPTTIDEWYNVLKAFKTQDPNGNGKDDEIPYTTDYKMIGLTKWGSAWGLHLFRSAGLYVDKNGKVQYEWLDPRAKEMVTWLNRAFKEGLIDQEVFNMTSDNLMGKVSKNIVGSSYRFINVMGRWDLMLQQAGVKDENLVVVAPPAGPNGYKGHQEKYGPISGYWGITKDCKNKEVLIKWLDYVFASEEGNRFACFGIEGKSYTMVNGEPKFTDWAIKNPDGLDINSALRSLGSMPTLPWIRSERGPLSKQPAATIAHLPKTIEGAKKIQPYAIDAFPTILPLPEESQEIQSIMTELDTYRDETIAKFITGQMSLDNWDKFVSTLKSMRIEDYLRIKQKQYERFNK